VEGYQFRGEKDSHAGIRGRYCVAFRGRGRDEKHDRQNIGLSGGEKIGAECRQDKNNEI